ncbi:uncharacterized protein [Atheta coriaria]|uniref:uncharacterized protein n=1 Tax=Dalotia coriaria TaxID=877792 RepID=UPI0031F36C26
MIIPATTASYKEVTPIETPKTAENDDGEKEKSTTIPTICRDPSALVSPRMVIQRNTPPLSVIQGEEGYDINRMVNYPEESTFINTKPSPRVIRYPNSATPGISTYHESSNILDHESYPQVPTRVIKSEGVLEASKQVNIPENQLDIQGIPMMGARSVHYSKTGSSIPSMVSASIYSAPRSVSYTKYSSGSISPGEIGVGGGGRVGFNDGGRLKYSRTVSSIGGGGTGGIGGQISGGYTSGSIGGYPIGDGTLSDDYRVVTDNGDTPKNFGSYRGRYVGYNIPGRGSRYYGGYKY